MRFLVALVMLGGVARADPPAWVASCTQRLEATLAKLAEEDPRLRGAHVQHRSVCLMSSLRDSLGVSIDVAGSGELTAVVTWGPEVMPTSVTRRGRDGRVEVLSHDATVEAQRFIDQMSRAVGACLAEVPPPPVIVDDPTWPSECRRVRPGASDQAVASCVESERAVRDIEAMCMFDTDFALRRVLASDDAPRQLQHLARASNPVARMYAIEGFERIRGPLAPIELERLTHDTGSGFKREGCLGLSRRVADVAAATLHRNFK